MDDATGTKLIQPKLLGIATKATGEPYTGWWKQVTTHLTDLLLPKRYEEKVLPSCLLLCPPQPSAAASYSVVMIMFSKKVVTTGVEPATAALLAQCSTD